MVSISPNEVERADPKSAKRFFCLVRDEAVGPFDLIELAGHLRCAEIDAETSIRLENEEAWRTFRETPEFTLAQEISIEEIARHLAEKASSGSAALPRQKLRFWIGLGTVFALCLGAIAALDAFLEPTPSTLPHIPPPRTLSWQKQKLGDVSFECPIKLDLLKADYPERASFYRGDDFETEFGLYFDHQGSGPKGGYDSGYGQQFDLIESLFRFRLKPIETSRQDVIVNGNHQRDLQFTYIRYHTTTFIGKVRIIASKGRIYQIWVLGPESNFAPDTLDRFLTSLKLP